MTAACRKTEPPPASLPPPVSEEGFEKQDAPRPGEWLYVFKEKGQTFDQYVGTCANRLTPQRRIFYIQPLGTAAERHRRTLESMREYAAVFFNVEARLCDPIPMVEEAHVPERDQYNSGKIIEFLTDRVPSDALVYIGITDKDLFARGLNFVFGSGSLEDRTGIYSLVRYESPDPALFLRRALKLMSHEVGHILSIEHCVHYKCVMQGANSLPEDDRHPMHLCPVDLRKLQWNTSFDRADRYRRLEDFYRRAGLGPEATWTAERSK